MRKIPLTRGLVAIVDDEDYPRLAQHKWSSSHVRSRTYALREVRDGQRLYMHREIARPGIGRQVDHVNGDGLDNRRANLRLASGSQNRANTVRRSHNTSGFKGVSRQKGDRRWRAQITVGGHNLYLGDFAGPREAARAYDQAALKFFGEFARTNAMMGLL